MNMLAFGIALGGAAIVGFVAHYVVVHIYAALDRRSN